VKRTLIMTAALLGLAVLLYVGRSWAQQGTSGGSAPAAAPLRTRIALLNIPYILRYYHRAITFQNEMKVAAEPFQKRETDFSKELEATGKEVQDPKLPPAKREELEWKVKGLQRQIEDNRTAAQMALRKKADEQLVLIYRDIQDAAKRYARAHEFDVVLHYNDAITEQDYYSAANIARKLQVGTLMPLYASPGMDISQEIVNTLNYNAPAAQGAQGTPPQAPAPAAGTN
jgi:Skp family chaperone for outer membrane proteins